MKKLLFVAAGAALSLSVAAHAGDSASKAAETLASLDRTGETQTCLPIRRIEHIKAVDDATFLVQVGRSDYYLNEASSQCHQASTPSHRIQFKSDLSSLCENQIISVVNSSGFTVGSCTLGQFEKLEAAEG